MTDFLQGASSSISKIGGDKGYNGSASNITDGSTSTSWNINGMSSYKDYQCVFDWSADSSKRKVNQIDISYRLRREAIEVSYAVTTRIRVWVTENGSDSLLLDVTRSGGNTNDSGVITVQKIVSYTNATKLKIRIYATYTADPVYGYVLGYAYCYDAKVLSYDLPTSGAGFVCCVGDVSDHGGSITSSNQDGTVTVAGTVIAVSGAILACPIHGNQSISAITTKSKINGKLVLTYGATAACGAKIYPPDRKLYVEA